MIYHEKGLHCRGRSLVKLIRNYCHRCRYLMKRTVDVMMGPVPKCMTISPVFYFTHFALSGPYSAFHLSIKERPWRLRKGCEEMRLNFRDLQSRLNQNAAVEFAVCHNMNGKVERKIREVKCQLKEICKKYVYLWCNGKPLTMPPPHTFFLRNFFLLCILELSSQ